MKNKLKSVLVGKIFKQESYSEELNNILKDFNVEANTWDFDFDRLFYAGYEDRKDGDADYIGSLDTEFITKGEEESEEYYIKIIDII